MTRRRPYDWKSEDERAAVEAWVDDARRNGWHVGVAILNGPHLCTCGQPWPCEQVKADVPSLR